MPLYLSEVAPTHLRGSLGAVFQLAVALGILAAYLTGLVAQRRQPTAVACSADLSGGKDAPSQLTLHGGPTLDLTCGELVAGWTCEAMRDDATAGERFACEVGHAATRVQRISIAIQAPCIYF